jgi:hypothetical protein
MNVKEETMSRAFLVYVDDTFVGIFSSFRYADNFCHEQKYYLHSNFTVWIHEYHLNTTHANRIINWSKLKKEA